MNKKTIVIGIIVLIILATGAGLWGWQRNESREQKEEKTQQFLTDEMIDAGDWKIYKNYKYGFEIKYPKDWNLRKDNRLGFDKHFFEKDELTYFGVFPRGGFGHGIQEPRTTYEKFKEKDAKMFWYNFPYPSYIYILKDFPENWNDENGIEIRGASDNVKILQEMYDSFKFI